MEIIPPKYSEQAVVAENERNKFSSILTLFVDDTSLAATEQSDNSSALEEMESGDTSTGSDPLNIEELEQLSHELANKGRPRPTDNSGNPQTCT